MSCRGEGKESTVLARSVDCFVVVFAPSHSDQNSANAK